MAATYAWATPAPVGGSLGGHRPSRDAVRHRQRRRGRGRRGSRTAPASPLGRRAPRVAREGREAVLERNREGRTA